MWWSSFEIRNTTWIITTAAAMKKQDRYYMFMDTSYQYWKYHEMTSLKTSKSIKLQQQGLTILISIRLYGNRRKFMKRRKSKKR